MTRRVWVVIVTLCTLVVSQPAIAATPSLMNYQGILTDGSGAPQAGGPFSVTFSIYDAATATNPAVWTEVQSVMTDSKGRFNVLLGTVTSLTDTVFSGSSRWLGTTVSPDVSDLLPRTPIVSVAYAFRPATVDGATGGVISGEVSLGGLRLLPGAQDGYVLTSDVEGIGSWQPSSSSPPNFSGTFTQPVVGNGGMGWYVAPPDKTVYITSIHCSFDGAQFATFVLEGTTMLYLTPSNQNWSGGGAAIVLQPGQALNGVSSNGFTYVTISGFQF